MSRPTTRNHGRISVKGAFTPDRAVIRRNLKHIGEDARGRWYARARDPCDPWA
jgi:hypothetical protein